MSKDEKKIKLPADDTPSESSATDSTIPPEIAAELDEEEKEFRALRRDLPGVKGSSAAGIVTISVGKSPTRLTMCSLHRHPSDSCTYLKLSYLAHAFAFPKGGE